jgi:hypothetical protein
VLLLLSSPDLTQELTTDATPTGFLVCQNALRRTEDTNSETAENTWNVLVANVHSTTGTGNPLDAAKGAASVASVLQRDGQCCLNCGTEFLLTNIGNVALILEQLSDCSL